METVEFTLRGGSDDFIQLIQLLKATHIAFSGSEAQELVLDGMVKRNGELETRKRAKIVAGDVIECDGIRIEVKA